MSVVANVAINVDAGKALSALKGLDGAVQGLGNRIKNIGQGISGLAGALAGIGAGAALGGFIKAGIEADRTAKTIKALSGQFGEAEAVTKLASQAAKEYGLGQTQAAKAVADLYGRLRPTGVSLENIGVVFNGVNKAAGLLNLTAAETDGVLLQLSQALGSGSLQGDELRSVLERLPSVGQAVAKVLGVTVGEVKKLGADGKITTDVIIKALAELNKVKPPPPDAYKLFQASLQDLSTTIGTQLLPAFTPLVQKISELATRIKDLGVATTIAEAFTPLANAALGLLDAFAKLDPSTQKLIIQVGTLAGAFLLIAVPLGIFLQGIGSILKAAPFLIGLFGNVGKAILGIGPVLGTVARILVGFFTGPAGWITLAIAAGIAIFTFRDQIAEAFSGVGEYFSDLAGGFQILVDAAAQAGQGIFNGLSQGLTAAFDFISQGFSAAVEFIITNFVRPVAETINALYTAIVDTFKSLGAALVAPFQTAANAIRSIFNAVIGILQNTINGVVSAINKILAKINAVSSKVGIPAIPLLEAPQLPRFAEGGYVTRETVAVIGEAGSEYVIPASKMQEAMQRYANGARGASVIPGSSGTSGAGGINPQVSITTGPVMQMNNETFVTQRDLMNATQQAAQQGANLALRSIQNSPSLRRNAGLTR